MRFLVMVKGNKDYEAGAMPTQQELTDRKSTRLNSSH